MTFVHQHLEEVDSTNSALWELSEKIQLSEFHTISTDFQWKGKGQDTNSWHSKKSHNILFSSLVFPDFLLAADAFQISRWISLSIVDYLKSHKIADISIKWPNDIYVGNRKIAGILIQNAISGDKLSKCLIGIGININQTIFPMELPNPVSLGQLKKQEYDVLEELHMLIGICKRNFNQLRKNPEKLIKNYHQSLYQLNTWDYYKVKDELIKGRIIGVDQFGRLGLEQENSEISYFDLKEVKFILN